MAMTLAEIRAKLQAQENRGRGAKQSGGDNAVYPHWDAAEGTTSRIRFLSDGNPKNDFFWVTREMIRLPFAGVKGQADSKPVIVQVPCVEMYQDGSQCPILAEVRTWFKDPSMEEMGRKYWKKKSHIFQGFVRESAINEDSVPENPIRRFTISPQIVNIIIASLKDPEMENMPTDTQAGLDFNIKKTSKGGYADYSTSTWSRRESALTADEQAAIDQYGLYNLSDFLPKKPTDADLKVIKEMFEASVDGMPYDAERWGNYYKPYGLEVPATAAKPDQQESAPVARAAAPAPAPAPAPAATETAPWEDEETQAASAPVAAPKPAAGGNVRAEDILAQIRSRQKQ